MNAKELYEKRKYLRSENKRWPTVLKAIPRLDWPKGNEGLEQAFRSRDFLVQVIRDGSHLRITINRTDLGKDGHWIDGITWDELMNLKAQAGYADCWAVEVYPPPSDVVNVANMRHLWLLPEKPAFAWGKESK